MENVSQPKQLKTTTVITVKLKISKASFQGPVNIIRI